MKKILFLVMAMFSFVSQAQTEFDFSCGNSVTVTLRFGENFTHDFVMVEGVPVTSQTIPLPAGWSITTAIPSDGASWAGSGYKQLTMQKSARSIGNKTLGLKLRDAGEIYGLNDSYNFDYSQDDFEFDISSKFSSYLTPPDSVTIKVKFAEGFTHDVVFTEGVGIVEADVPLPDGWSIKNAIPLYPGGGGLTIGAIGNETIAWSRSHSSLNANTVGIRLRPATEVLSDSDVFDYTQDDFTLDVSLHYKNYFSIPEPEEVDVKVKVADGIELTKTISEDDDNNTTSYDIDLPDGKVTNSNSGGTVWNDFGLGIEWRMTGFTKGATSIPFELRISDGFIWTQDNFTIDASNIYGSFITDYSDGEVNITVKVADGIEKTVTVTEGSNNTVPVTITLPKGYSVTEAITESSYAQDDTNALYKISSRDAGSSNVGVTLKTFTGSAVWDDFDYSQDDFTLDLSSYFDDKFVNYGDLVDFVYIDDANGTPQDISGESRDYRFWNKMSEDTYTEPGTYPVSGNHQHGTYGDSNIVFPKATWNALYSVEFQTSSSDSKFNDRRITGGVFDGYVKVNEPSYGGIVIFAKWTSGSSGYKVVIVTDSGWSWESNSVVQLGELDMWEGVAK